MSIFKYLFSKIPTLSRRRKNYKKRTNKKIGGFQPRTASRSASAINRKKSKKIVSFPI